MKTKMIEKDIATDLANAYNEGFYAGEKDMEAHYETIVLPKVRKETARGYYKAMKETIEKRTAWAGEFTVEGMLEENDDLAKQFGVEVE